MIYLNSLWRGYNEQRVFYNIVEEVSDVDSIQHYFETPLVAYVERQESKRNVLFLVACAYDGFRKICINRSKLILSDSLSGEFRAVDADKAWDDFRGAHAEFLKNNEDIKCSDAFDKIICKTNDEDNITRALTILGLGDNFKELYDVYEILKGAKFCREKVKDKKKKFAKEWDKKYEDFKFTANNPAIGFSSRHAGVEHQEKSAKKVEKVDLHAAQTLIFSELRTEINDLYGFSLTESRLENLDRSDVDLKDFVL